MTTDLMSTSRHILIKGICICISTRKQRLKLDGQNSMIEELKKAEEQLQEAIKKRSDRYRMIQDMTISATKTAGIMKGIKILNSQITSFQNNVNTIKDLMGYHQDEIKKTELKKKTII